MCEILFIDDDQSILDTAEKVLSHFGYGVKIARDGDEGIELLRNGHEFGLVITDIRMPGRDGNQVAKYIRENKNLNRTPVVAITGFPAQAERDLFDSVIPKPFKFTNLINLIHSFDTS
jgi:CheY-like chemotaxis protein